MAKSRYRRILLKLSGEALLGHEDYGIDPEIIGRIASEISDVTRTGTEVAVVIGGGNIFRGAGLAESHRRPSTVSRPRVHGRTVGHFDQWPLTRVRTSKPGI